MSILVIVMVVFFVVILLGVTFLASLPSKVLHDLQLKVFPKKDTSKRGRSEHDS